MSLEDLEIRKHTAPLEKELNHQKEKNGRLKRELKDLRQVLGTLLERMDFVHNSPEYRSVWECSQLHQGPYRGPTYTEAFEKAEEILNERKEGKGSEEAVSGREEPLDPVPGSSTSG